MGKEVLISQSLYESTVKVQGQFALTATAASPAIPVDLVSYLTPPGAGAFLYNEKYIVTSSQNVIIPPQFLAGNNRFPYVSATQPIPNGSIPDTVTQVSRIIVSVNALKCNEVVNYEARLVSVSPSGDVAFLKLVKCCDKKLCIKESRVLRYAESEECANGASLYTYSLPTGFLSGTMANNMYSSPNGTFQAEHILVDIDIDEVVPGMPVVDENYYLVGMLTQGNHGPSERFMKYITDRMLYMDCKKFRKEVKCKKEFKHTEDHFTIITDALLDSNGKTHTFSVYRVAYLGVLYTPVNQNTYDTTIDPVTGEVSLIFDSTGNIVYKCGVENKGIQIVTLAGNTDVEYTVLPGLTPVTPPFPALVNSPVSSFLGPQDIIVKFGSKCEAGDTGDEGCSLAPGLYLWRADPEDNLTIKYKLFSEQFAKYHTQKDIRLVYKPLALEYPPRIPTYTSFGPSAPVVINFSAPL
jgi:hypothetical protein